MGKDIATMSGIFAEYERRRREAVFEVYELGQVCKQPVSDFGSQAVRDEVVAMERAEAEHAVERCISQWNDKILPYFGEKRRKNGWTEEQISAAMARHRRTRDIFDWPPEFA